MKKILLLTKINPIEILDTMIRLYHSGTDIHKTLFFSPQYTALLASEKTKAPFQNVFYSSLEVWEREKEKVLAEHPEYKTVVVVGTVDIESKNWYDAIVGLENPDIENYVMNEEFNQNNITYLTLQHAEIKFNTLDEFMPFLNHIIKLSEEEENNAIQSISEGSDRKYSA